MKCYEVEQFLREHVTVFGVEYDADIMEHVDNCPKCRELFDGFSSFSDRFQPLTDISLTLPEIQQIEETLDAGLIREPAPIPIQPKEKTIFPIVRVLIATAAVFVMVLLSSNPTQNSKIAVVDEWSTVSFASLDDTDVASILFDSEDDIDILPALIDQSSVTYISDQVQPGQVDDILDSITDDELAWLEKNYSLEI